MKTITSVKEMWLSLEQIYREYVEDDEVKLINMSMEDKSDGIKRQWKRCKSFDVLVELVFKEQQWRLKDLSKTGKYTSNTLTPPIDFIEKDCSIVAKCFHSNSENELSDPDDSESESKNERSICYFIDMTSYTGYDLGNVECDRNLEDVKSNILLTFEIISKNKQVNVFRDDIMFVLDKVTNLQGQNQAYRNS